MPWNLWSLSGKRWMLLQSVRSKAAAEAEIKNFPEDSRDLQARRVRPMLEQHGTTLMQLKPGAIWRIAMSDLERRERNKERGIGEYERFAFHRDHVTGAKTANDILRAAIADIELGRQSDKADTRLLYADEELLRRSLQ